MRVVPAGAGSDDEEAAADGALEREAAGAAGAGARGVEDHDVALVAGQHVEAGTAQRARRGAALRGADERLVDAAAALAEDRHRPDARQIALERERRLLEHDRGDGHQLVAGMGHRDRAAVTQRELA